MAKVNGITLWEGASVLDGSPIALIATLKTSNVKTGDMVQTWIIRTDINPVEATKTGLDASICGACPHRHYLGGACYVNVGQAPNAVYKAFHAGKYPLATIETAQQMLKGRKLRMGAYGDPAAVPADIWEALLCAVDFAGHTGYTHQASHPNFDPRILQWCMVSADTPKQAAKLQNLGYRTFRVKTPDAPALEGEIECLSDSKGITCADCLLCDASKQAASVYINVHGSRSSRYVNKYGNANLIAVAA